MWRIERRSQGPSGLVSPGRQYLFILGIPGPKQLVTRDQFSPHLDTVILAFNNMDIGSATLLFFVSMLLTMYTVGFLFLGEKMTKVKIVSFVLAIAGMYFIFSFSLVAFTFLAAAMAMLNGVASGGEISSSKKFSDRYSTLYITWLSWVVILVTNAPLSFVLGERILFPAFEMVWVWQLAYTIASMLAFWLIIEGLKYVEAGIGGLLGLLEIVFSIALGIWLFGEDLTTQVIVGSALILCAAALPHIKEIREKRLQKPLR